MSERPLSARTICLPMTYARHVLCLCHCSAPLPLLPRVNHARVVDLQWFGTAPNVYRHEYSRLQLTFKWPRTFCSSLLLFISPGWCWICDAGVEFHNVLVTFSPFPLGLVVIKPNDNHDFNNPKLWKSHPKTWNYQEICLLKIPILKFARLSYAWWSITGTGKPHLVGIILTTK